ncbi:SusC/RagA family TonB-linked outer membrane protein [Mucilaginibacter sp.]|uniref:SusC/RagA family TonB-linked outer membrane protein n=1 Tax=Mucilaginibacter sp. TaxID=1882438 RepID=UPI00262B45C6|nr:SusC/RagA family TonB-linked outer membrane protein [Mucilaginibacter sp.]MDB4927503.1 hypothetical protein [Mucilaginibacter sp.]
MKKLLLVSLCFLVLCVTQVFAQNRTVTGTVTAKDDGLPIPGVTVKIKGTSVGVPTDVNGKFSISAPPTAVLVFNFIGYASQEVSASSTQLKVMLETTTNQLSEVVVNTAFGVKRTSESLGYTTTSVSAKELKHGGVTNFTNGLAGKVAGLVVTTQDNGINPATRFTLRGTRHINGNNFALVVLNGVPISPNDVNTISPDDIESVDVLNGAAASALYGSEASNGVMVITTKKGSSNGAPQISYSNTYQLEKLANIPATQKLFGSYGGETGDLDPNTGFITHPISYENQSYGPLYDGSLQVLGIPLENGTTQKYPYSHINPDSRWGFYQTAHTEQNALSYSQGDAATGNTFNLSLNRLDKTAITPGDTYQRTIVRISAAHTYGKFKADFTASYSKSDQSTGADPINTLINTPSWVPLQNFQNIYSDFADRNTYFNSYNTNPYAGIAESRTNVRQDAFNGSFSGVYTFNKWLDATYRLATNFGTYQSQFTQRQRNYSQYALSDPGGTGNRASGVGTPIFPGQVTNISQFGDASNSTGAGPQGFARTTQDMLVHFQHDFLTNFKADARIGATIWEENYNRITNSSTSLFIQDFYNIGYISGQPTTTQESAKIRQTGYFGDLNLAYKNVAFIEGTVRNEHDSRLAESVRSIWFPSANASIVLTNAIPALKDNKYISYLKVRGGWAEVGDVNIGPYLYQPTSFSVPSVASGGFPYGSLTALYPSANLNNPALKPEVTRETELGLELGLFDGRITGSATYYNNHTTNQTLQVTTSPSIGYTSTTLNVGDVRNYGMEFRLSGQVLTKAKNKVGLDLSGNLAIQDSKVLSIIPGINAISITNNNQAIVGLAFPQLVGTDILRDGQGHAVVNAATGYPVADPTVRPLGRTTPKYILGLTQTVSYKFITLTVTSEFRTGYVVYLDGLRTLTGAGISAFSASTGRSRFVFPNSVINTGTTAAPVYVTNTNSAISEGNINFWDSGAFYNANTTYTTSGAYWKLREADLVFDLTSFTKSIKAIKRISIAVNGRNLLMFRPKTNQYFDPEFGGTGNNQGFVGTTLATRIFGGSLNVTF